VGAEPSTVVFASHGVTIEIAVGDPRVEARVLAVLPPGWEHGDPALVSARFAIGPGGHVAFDGVEILPAADDAVALGVLDAAIRAAVALNAPEHVFVHAGVVAVDGHAIVLPGASLTGKSTLVAALVRAGASYFSDEFAVLDATGLVHPYPKPLSLREPGSLAQVDVPAGSLGAVGSGPARVALIAAVPFVGAESELHPGTAGDGALALLSHAIAARSRPAAVLEASRAAATGARYLHGARGEADSAAAALLDLISAPGATERTLPARQSPAAPRA
jgi:hypothetical protein